MPQRVDFDRHAAERGHGVDQQQRAGVVDDAWRSPRSAARRRWRSRPCTMPTTLGFALATALAISSGVKTSPQGRSIVRDLGAGPLGDVDHAAAEDAVDADDHRVARLDEVDDRRLHARRAGAADGERHAVLACGTARAASPCSSFMSSR